MFAKPSLSMNPFGLKVRKSRVCTMRAGQWPLQDG